mmetsp:Transcript_76026/g.123473  ORF Transcript_76026/g.123473 Transcript_76026/m.123473 type:complete len:261 (+) Transcript_76026:102-884(+)|eukprot:CAMPEP_0179415720 /NCGR_PEP_ID=MMETSP0799-20121207/6396_1 /TAXON_ID=46947 /ORGANISM="Geminigera cryophila, Strain CCMP2564" /LENGTH=260 /DNA_ID=CAMNT_0021188505 /DNA_START=575 /DNA_END=1357 /DNA_ORIENTATION=-
MCMQPKKPAAPAATTASKKAPKKENENSLFQRSPKNFGIGNNVQPKKDLSRMVKMPKNVRMQRQRRILYTRLKVPPAIAQFTKTVDKNSATDIFKMLNKYRPESKEQKDERRKATAEKGAAAAKSKDQSVKCGINQIARLVESKKATMVIIAHDVDPIELVVWLPALCRKMDVPYCIVKGKARLGQVVYKKTATALAFTTVKSEDQGAFAKLVDNVKSNFNDRGQDLMRWGGGIMGAKSQERTRQKEKAVAREAAKRMQA